MSPISQKVIQFKPSPILSFVESLSGKRVYAQFADSSLAVHGITFFVQKAEFDQERQLFRLFPQGADPWVFRYVEVTLLTEERLVLRGEDAVLRLEVVR